MKSHIQIVFCSLMISLILGCVSNSRRPPAEVRAEDRQKIVRELAPEVPKNSTGGSSAVPAESAAKAATTSPGPQLEAAKKDEELATFLSQMNQGKENPSMVRDRFSALLQKRRADFRRKVDSLREDYRAEETRQREDFMNDQRRRREDYMAKKHDYKETARFTGDLDRERIRYFTDERDRRSAFESEINSQSKDFDSYMRERQNQFNEQFRVYSKQLSEKPKDKKAATGDEFKRLDSVPASPLGTED